MNPLLLTILFYVIFCQLFETVQGRHKFLFSQVAFLMRLFQLFGLLPGHVREMAETESLFEIVKSLLHVVASGALVHKFQTF